MVDATAEKELKSLYDSGALGGVAQKIKSEFEKYAGTTLQIAVTGESGSGKSSFINALRGIDDGQERAAPTGETEPTMEPKVYHYPNKATVSIWDLPGIGTPNFQASEYLERVKFDRYDFFIILSASRFTENDARLATEIQQRKKKFYFVRSKIDQDLESAKHREKSQYNEKTALEKVRNDSLESLKKEGIKSPQVFLISSRNLDKFDFEKLQEVLEGGLPALKRRAFLLSLPNIASSVIEKKKDVMMDEIRKLALLSAGAAVAATMVPIPGLSIACDVPLLVRRLSSYRTYFGLDDDSLGGLAKREGKMTEELRSEVKSTFGEEVTENVVVKELKKIAGAKSTVRSFLKFMPIAGQATAASASYTNTHALLKTALEEMAEDSKRVQAKAFLVMD